MKIKEIKLYGFKSFPEETKIILDAGITAFVGPNGSGKSNIFDALRWIFGEQSMKALRCERIEDLIYISPDTKNDANFTEVSITIDNEDFFPQFGGEFEIKRRFYRSGDSEFFLNRVKCRLQDIQALFLDSGTLTYSFLELSEIEKIIHGNTKDMFNDVSGILKYQERREQTKRRLEVTEQDLLRLEDIIHEMQRSLRSLKRQVRQTKLFQELKEEFKTLTLFILKSDYNKAVESLTKIQEQIGSKETQRQSVLAEIKKLEVERENLKSEMAQIEVKKKDTLTLIAAVDESTAQLQKMIDEKDEQMRQIILANERTVTSIKEKEEQLRSNERKLADHEKRRVEVSRDTENIKICIEKEQEQLRVNNEEYFSLKENLKEKDNILLELSRKIHLCEQEIARLNFEKDNKSALTVRINEECNVQNEEIDNRKRQLKRVEKELDSIITQQEELAGHLDEVCGKVAETERDLSNIGKELKSRQDALTDCKIVIDSLIHRLKEKGSAKEIEAEFGKRLRGLFRDNIEVIPGYESAVDVCLGDILNFYLLDNYKLSDFDRLPDGRFGFISTKTTIKENASRDLSENLPSIAEFVRLKSYQEVLQKYIENYYVIDDFKRANEFSEKYPGFGFVTRDGVLFKNGIIILEKGEIGYFKMSQSLEEYKNKNEKLRNEVLFFNEEKKRLLSEIDEGKRKIEDEKNRLFTINVKKSECSLNSNELKRSVQKLVKEYDNLQADRDALIKEEESLVLQIGKLENDINDIRDESTKIEREKNSLVETLKTTEKSIEEKNSFLNGKRMDFAALEERLNSIDAAIRHLKNETTIIETEITTLKEEAPVRNLGEIEKEMQTLKQKLEEKKKERFDIESLLPEKVIEELTRRLNNIFDQLTEKQKANEEIQSAVMQLKYESFQLTHKRDEAMKKAMEDFKVALVDYTPEEDVLGADARILDVKGKLEKLGEINPLSLQLYENEKKRLDEFLAQRDDIIAAKKNLLRSIEELDTRARERFVETFEQVKKEFNFVFSNFFEGGKADLVLSDPSNPLISKVDIIVRMKGKRLKTINQLSGGERTLLAISLLLAFYLVKPAPFCILDEIDAPLDDANVVRFNKFLRDLSQRTQVVIITHNRATMEYADYLYGLTMERPGQSKIISARLADLEKIGSLESDM